MPNYKVSVVITNFNQGHLIKQAIDSIYTQSILPDELIVVDDCSTDDSKVKIKELLKNRPKTISTKLLSTMENAGPATARNIGLYNMKGDVVAFLDADDYYYPDKIKKSLAVFDRFNEVALVYTDYDVWDVRDGRKYREFKHAFDFHKLTQTCIVSTNSIIRKSVLEATGPFNPNLSGAGFSRGEDYELWLRISKVAMLYHIPEALFCYRLHGGNVTLTAPEKIIEGEKIWKPQLLGAKQ